jgi:hypothetical protein
MAFVGFRMRWSVVTIMFSSNSKVENLEENARSECVCGVNQMFLLEEGVVSERRGHEDVTSHLAHVNDIFPFSSR